MTETIRLGGRDFTLRPPTLGQLRHLLDALDAMTGASGGALIDAAARLVAAGLAAAHPELTVAAVLDLDASLAELNTAVAAILQSAGLSPVGEADPRVTPGEMPSSATIANPRARLGGLYGALATGCGYSYRIIDDMTLAEAGEIFRYWEDNPPPYLLLQTIARLLGWQPSRTQSQSSIDALAQLAAAPPPGLAVMPVTQIAMPQAVFDLETLRARNTARQKPQQ